LEEARGVPIEELVEYNMLEEKVEMKLSDETTELESVVVFQANATGDEGKKGDQVDLPFDVYEEEELELSRLHERRCQPTEKLEEVIEEIREIMLKSVEETNSRRKLNGGEHAQAAGKKKQSRGAGGQLQRRAWDPGRFQHWRRGAHEKELMIRSS
jgi:hypothetical protein